jgi:hypothetical protein
MRALAERLVWTAGSDSVRTGFRILGDGSLTDLDDAAVSVEAHELVRLAHAEVLDAVDSAAWLQHFADYKLEPLFRQFGRPRFAVDDAQLDQSELLEVAGAVSNGLALSRFAAKLGWRRGPIGDGPSFDSYLRKFAGPGVVERAAQRVRQRRPRDVRAGSEPAQAPIIQVNYP